jgi:Lipocalin-like domain
MPVIENPILGRWRLLSWQIIIPDGQKILPLGERPRGVITYGTDGRMNVFLAAESRGTLNALGRGTLDERAAAFDTFAAYCGTYEIVGVEIVHRIDLASIPAMTDTEVRRAFSNDGERLSLSYSFPSRDGGIANGELAFQRE